MRDWIQDPINMYGVIVLTSAVGLAGYQWINWSELGGSTYASWIQAVGAITAIFGAYFIGERQAASVRRHAIEAEARQGESRLDSILSIMSACEKAVDEIHDSYNNNASGRFALALTYDERVFDGFIRAITSINLHEIKTSEGIVAMIGAQQSLARMQADINEFYRKPISPATTLYGGNGPDQDALQLGNQKNGFRAQYKELLAALHKSQATAGRTNAAA